jgi:mRNA-degrading endonuclease toxin of MazEF toxin-antitoxin module
MEKNFDQWNELKQRLDKKEKRLPTFKEREIWWCHLGLNIGDEENGKNEKYHRPVLIIRKFNNNLFLAVPLTTQVKEKPYYYKILIKNKEQCAMISQLRILASKRLDRRMGKITTEEFISLKKAVREKIL